jgi:hypothetical protein
MKLKKIIEKPIKKNDIDKLKWLYSGIIALEEKSRKAALENDLEFMEKKGKFLTPEEFHEILFKKRIKKELIPKAYRNELERYHNMFVSSVTDILNLDDLKDVEIGRMIGLPAAKENLFELKRKGKTIGFVHFNEKEKTIDFIADAKDLPKEFKKKLKKK